MKEFVIYTGLRLALFAATLGIVLGIWVLVADRANVVVAALIAFVASGVGSWFLLQRPRSAFAQQVEARASRATAAFDAMRAREDEARADEARANDEAQAHAAVDPEAASGIDHDQTRKQG